MFRQIFNKISGLGFFFTLEFFEETCKFWILLFDFFKENAFSALVPVLFFGSAFCRRVSRIRLIKFGVKSDKIVYASRELNHIINPSFFFALFFSDLI